MATLNSTLTITSTDLTSDTLTMTISPDPGFTCTHTSGIARKAITSTAIGTGSGQVTIDTANEFASPSIIYIKNTHAYHASQNVIYCYFDGDGTDTNVLQIHGGQFAYIPASSDLSLKAYASHTATVVEYAVFGTLA
jgi:hypothetical protein